MQFDELLEVISLLYQYNDYALMFIKTPAPLNKDDNNKNNDADSDMDDSPCCNIIQYHVTFMRSEQTHTRKIALEA